jgi:6-phosphofructokinase 1
MNPKRASRIAVLFSGGDASGMNPYLRAFVRIGLNRHNVEILGVKDGFKGMVQSCQQLQQGDRTLSGLRKEIDDLPGMFGLLRPSQSIVRMDHDSVRGLTGRGGIILGTAREPAFHDALVRKQVIDLLAGLDVAATIICGGNGSLAGAARLAAESDLQVIGIPASIDNDIPATEMALGVDTAVNSIVRVIEQCNDTANSHHRIMIVETMGRDSGELARMAALAAGAEIVVTPERGPLGPEKMRGIANRLEKKMRRGRMHAIVVVAEGVKTNPPSAETATLSLARYLDLHFRGSKRPGLDPEVRVNVLGHLQRGGPPLASDRLLAVRFARACWRVLVSYPQRSGVLGLCRGRIALRPFGRNTSRPLPAHTLDLYETFKEISQWP